MALPAGAMAPGSGAVPMTVPFAEEFEYCWVVVTLKPAASVASSLVARLVRQRSGPRLAWARD